MARNYKYYFHILESTDASAFPSDNSQGSSNVQYRFRQMGFSLTHSARIPPAVHPGITIWVDKIELEIEKNNFLKFFFDVFLGGGANFFFNFFSQFQFRRPKS